MFQNENELFFCLKLLKDQVHKKMDLHLNLESLDQSQEEETIHDSKYT